MKLILIRGLPGSGKSTMARDRTELDPNLRHYETDAYWLRPDGTYDFNRAFLARAHEWCQQKTKRALQEGQDVVVSNTFVKHWEMQPYIEMARELGAEWEIIEAKGNYKNIHNVPEEAIQRMRDNWEPL